MEVLRWAFVVKFFELDFFALPLLVTEDFGHLADSLLFWKALGQVHKCALFTQGWQPRVGLWYFGILEGGFRCDELSILWGSFLGHGDSLLTWFQLIEYCVFAAFVGLSFNAMSIWTRLRGVRRLRPRYFFLPFHERLLVSLDSLLAHFLCDLLLPLDKVGSGLFSLSLNRFDIFLDF